MTNDQIKLRASLADAIGDWHGENHEQAECMDTYVSSNIYQLMADAAFSVYMAQSSLTEYLRKEGDLK